LNRALVEHVQLVVERAGCPSWAGRIREAMGVFAAVESVELDEPADEARVRLSAPVAVSEAAVERALRNASVGSGHEYRVRPGSWVATG
jgi:hypothetical protein